MRDRLQELQHVLHTEIPITKYIQLSVDSYNDRGIKLGAPLAENMNHFGAVFAGSLSTVATLSGWSMLWYLLRELDMDGTIVIQNSHCDYLVPVTKDFSAYCYKPAGLELSRFEQTLRRRGRARMELYAEIMEEDVTAVTFKGRYVVSLK